MSLGIAARLAFADFALDVDSDLAAERADGDLRAVGLRQVHALCA